MTACQYLEQVPLYVYEGADPLPRSGVGLDEEEERTQF